MKDFAFTNLVKHLNRINVTNQSDLDAYIMDDGDYANTNICVYSSSDNTTICSGPADEIEDLLLDSLAMLGYEDA